MRLNILFTSALAVAAMSLFPATGLIAQPRVVENDRIALTLDTRTGLFSVLDKEAKVKWAQFSERQRIRKQKPRDLLKIRKAAGKIAVDGSLADWAGIPPIKITPDMVAHAKAVSGASDLSAEAYVLWDDTHLYVAVKVTDDKLAFRDTSKKDKNRLRWWEKDSVEVWLGAKQIGFVLHPTASIVTTTGGELAGCRAVAKEVKGGYVVEASIPLTHLPDLNKKAGVGRRVAFAVGINDADATGAREGQIYYPSSWEHSRPETFADAVLVDAGGRISEALLKKTAPKPDGVVHNLREIDRGLEFQTEIPMRGKSLPVKVRITVPRDGSDVHVEIEGPNEEEMTTVSYPLPLVPEQGESWMVLAPYADGLLLPLRRDKLPRTWWGCDMPFFGITSIETGCGYDCIFVTSADTRMQLRPMSKAKDAKMSVGPSLSPCMGKWGYPRKFLYRFCPKGGYVALAKAYRDYAKATGVLKTLREKMKRRPDVKLLLGAPDIWGASFGFCREAKAAGIDRMIVNGSFGVERTKAIIDMGYLASVYDNYEDIMAGKPNRYGDCKIPDDAPLRANGKRQLGWPVHMKDPKTGRTKMDPKTGKPMVKEQFYKRCSALDLPVAKRWIPRDQAKHPRNARFLDVTTATGLRECYDPNHYCTRAIDRKHKQNLAEYVGDELGLVLGGEHGRWWGVPYFDYWEGMQSGGFYSWPAGHVGMDLPEKREDISENYLTYGIGHYHRIPFWELVFGDCVVSYWYWGDSTGHLYNVAPEISYKKDLFNMLYANPPLYWVNRPFSFRWSEPKLRARLLESYRNTCKLHEQIGFDEMLSHQWLTEDRTVQKTVFSSGTFVVVNFDERKTYDLTDGDKTYTLSPLGFFARGTAVLQYRIRRDGRDVTYIKTPDYLFADSGGKAHDFGSVVTALPVTVRTLAPDRLKVMRPEGAETPQVRPAQIVPTWDMATTHVFQLGDEDKRLHELQVGTTDGVAIPLAGTGPLEIVCGKEYDLPNLVLDAKSITLSPSRPKQGETLTITVSVSNKGKTKAGDAAVAFYLDAATPQAQIGTQKLSLEGGASAKATCTLDTARVDGARKLIIVADSEGKIAELIEDDNSVEKQITIAPDYSKWHFTLGVEAVNGKVEQQDLPVGLAVDFGKQLRSLGGTGTFDVNSVRVCETKADGVPGRTVPCQFDKAPDFHAKANPKGEVVWLIPGKLSPGEKRLFLLYYDVKENGEKMGFRGTIWDPSSNTATTEGYTAVFDNGCIVDLYDKLGTVTDKSILTGLVYSSGQTGWTREENSEVLSTEVLGNGPLRAVVRIKKRLQAGLVYEKTYAFYARRFDLEVKANKALGNISRAYIALESTYEDSAGHKAHVDGTGNAEEVSGKCPNPKYYVIYAPGWAYSCVALSKFSNMTYWDGGSWGGVGLSGGDAASARMSYVIHPGQKDGTFGRIDSDRLTHPPTVRVVP